MVAPQTLPAIFGALIALQSLLGTAFSPPTNYFFANSLRPNSCLRPNQVVFASEISENEGGSHLINAGQCLIAAADALGSQNYACPHLLRDAGESLNEVGESWSESWEGVTYAAADAASFFGSLAQMQERDGLMKAYKEAGGALAGIASISGCISVGPPSSAPNLVTLSQSLKDASDLIEGEGSCKDSTALSRSLSEASVSISALATEYD